MTDTTYDVRIWQLKVRKNDKGKITSYGVRWIVAGEEFYESFKNSALADSFRSELMSAARKGEAFVKATGRPVSMSRQQVDVTWYEFACQYVDAKWDFAAATYRRTIAESLTSVTPVMFSTRRGKPDDKAIRSALTLWAFNTARRDSVEQPEHVTRTLRWIAKNSRPLSDVLDLRTVRAMLDALSTNVDGSKAASSVARQKRMVLSNSLNHAVEWEKLPRNPVPEVKWSAPKATRAVDRRSVPNPIQARTILNAVKEVQRSGPRLYAFFAVMYFAALRPEEVVTLKASNLTLPSKGWGEIILDKASPHAGSQWTDSGETRDARPLKHREPGEGRPVPCPPELVGILLEHSRMYPPDGDDRVFYGEKGGRIPQITYMRAWRAARKAALTTQAFNSPLAKRPYDLRHAAVSTWLNGGVAPTTVAKWAGHSVAVLLDVYAACVDGQEVQARRQVEDALGGQ
ncbi:Site-specific recombinase XerD [Actinopolyspora xinjiangensis]|uniref:Site-specific recombinase XerD n=1 Tax=Actinopolyspora xinjiangensis TaxID=405564 RepID=A0A1H0NPG4_9ACTN|nr:tyrosine-type recombinase/integrase [Actinopolyspora xinjiangensis]SDO94305.1 Site-specific recombinase XerD [Actinopolyspora xinjiangensis]